MALAIVENQCWEICRSVLREAAKKAMLKLVL